ncbi:MAG: hypothetical protein ABW148_00460 [Sedimenticola sp.]
MTHNRIIPSEEETERMVGTAHVFSGLAIASFVLFGAVILLGALIEKSNPSGVYAVKTAFDTFILIGASVPILFSIYAQQSFKLRTAL